MAGRDNVIRVTRELHGVRATAEAVYDGDRDLWVCSILVGGDPLGEARKARKARESRDAWAELRDMLDIELA